MASKLFPAGVLRGYLLDVEIHSSSDDEEYYLCFGTDGTMFVLVFYSPNNSWSKGYWSDRVLPGDFNSHAVDGKALRTLVSEKLQSILPPGAETCVGN
jgi:hypothetical protein